VKQGQRIFVKPNVCGGVPRKLGSFTNVGVLSATIQLLRKIDVAVSVGEAVKRPFHQATRIRVDRTLSRFSSELGYVAIHMGYESAVRSWKRAQQKG